MTGPIDPAGPSLGRDPDAASDRLSTGGQSITACRSLAAPVTLNRAARTVEAVGSTGARARAGPGHTTQRSQRSGRRLELELPRFGGHRETVRL